MMQEKRVRKNYAKNKNLNKNNVIYILDMKIHRKWWFWCMILIFLIIIFIVIHEGIKMANKDYCLSKQVGSYEYYDETYGFNVSGCPPKCTINTCYGLKTACCPKGISSILK